MFVYGVIYKITNNINKKVYIGQTVESGGFNRRYRNNLKDYTHNKHLRNSIIKYGIENFEICKTLDVAFSQTELNIKESVWIRYYNSTNRKLGYNKKDGGSHGKHTLEAKINMSKAQKAYFSTHNNHFKGKKRPQYSGEGNPNFGNHILSGEKHFNYGKHHSEETKQKIANSHTGIGAGEKNNSAINCVCYAKECCTGKIYKKNSYYSMRKLLENMGIKLNRACVIQVLRGERKTHKGFIFYREDISDKDVLDKIEKEYQSKNTNPVIIKDHRTGNIHPNAKNILCFCKSIKTGFIYKFDSWYGLKTYITINFSGTLNYSEMYKVAIGTQKFAKGFIFYREDITDKYIFNNIKNEYEKQTFNDYRNHIEHN